MASDQDSWGSSGAKYKPKSWRPYNGSQEQSEFPFQTAELPIAFVSSLLFTSHSLFDLAVIGVPAHASLSILQ